jgi:hypothetical protein
MRLPLNFNPRTLAWAWLMATMFSGAPSTLLALLTGGDVGKATWAAGGMLISPDAPRPALFAAAALVHGSVSAFWTLVGGCLLPRRHTLAWALAFSAAIGLLALKVIAPLAFPGVAALAFWPQMADHLMWGACLGVTLQRVSKAG